MIILVLLLLLALDVVVFLEIDIVIHVVVGFDATLVAAIFVPQDGSHGTRE